ncbi:copper resistance protein CopC [Agreia pratensis]|uniref:copper resistance CopC family protein n=1 Tax=Agreia pratensis TaxID=150121 RepID=UPI00111C904D|nr:copper resistance CopC family protein [Agreia pratensis]MBF4634572.1 copper resistance protein CopC [Agreia pratensis]
MTRRLFALPSALAATALLGAALVLAGASSASAHDALESSTPAAGEVVTADPTVVSLTYSDELITLGGDTSAFAIQVTDASGAFHENGCVVVDGTVASTGVALGDPGTYTATWQVVSSDGHPTSGSYTFEYQPVDTGNSLPGMAAAPACGAQWAGSPKEDSAPAPEATPEPSMTTMSEAPVPALTATADPAGDGEQGDDASRIGVAIAVSIAGLALIVTVIVLTVRRIRRDPFEKPQAPKGDDGDSEQ